MYRDAQRINQGVNESDIVYLNINIKGSSNPDKFIDAIYNENRTVPILDNPKDWIVGMIRFVAPSYNIPIFKWSTQYPQPLEDPNLVVYFRFNNILVSSTVKYITKTTIPLEFGRVIWNYTDFLTMINVAIADAFALIQGVAGWNPLIKCPRLVLDSTTNLISLYSDALMATGSGIDLIFSNLLYSYFPSFSTKENTLIILNKYLYILNINNNIINNVTYLGVAGYAMLQEYSTLSLWSGVDKLLFISNTIPVDTELDGGQLNIQSRVIFDFVIDNSQLNDGTAIIYNSQGNQRWYNLLSSFPMKQTDISVRILFKDGTTFPLRLLSTDTLTCKLQFVKKTSMTNLN